MSTYFEKMTDKEVQDWYFAWCKSYSKNHPIPNPNPQYIQSGQRYNVWNAYRYGNSVKLVYIKFGRNLKNFEKRTELKIEKREPTEKEKNERFSQSISRAKARIFELAMCNEFKYFCTFTQDQKKRNRFDLFEFRKDFTQFIRNQNRFREEDKKIKYILIPEQHKNGAWHMHGLLMGLTEEDLHLFTEKDKTSKKIKAQIKNGEKIYDWVKYRKSFGFFTCTEIQSKNACSKYVTKYISKDLQSTVHESGEHLFYASKGLKCRETLVKNSYDICPFLNIETENETPQICGAPFPKKPTKDTRFARLGPTEEKQSPFAQWDFENDYVAVKEMPLEDFLKSYLLDIKK